ncbi:MAG: flavodoxin family protein [Actinobacteria bacterium]|nr:flavodoxin family protein [Actinomycetota bacterium]
MNILAIGASARLDGNSNSLLRLAVDGARERGATADILHARHLKVQGCLGCDGCKRSPDAVCVVKDDMHDVYARLRDCDVLVLATPVYFYSMSSWLKAIVDRLWGLIGPDGAPRVEGGKGFYVITTEEEARTYAGQEIVGTLMRGLAWLEMDLRGELIAVNVDKAHDWEKRKDLARLAEGLITVA